MFGVIGYTATDSWYKALWETLPRDSECSCSRGATAFPSPQSLEEEHRSLRRLPWAETEMHPQAWTTGWGLSMVCPLFSSEDRKASWKHGPLSCCLALTWAPPPQALWPPPQPSHSETLWKYRMNMSQSDLKSQKTLFWREKKGVKNSGFQTKSAVYR